MTRTARASLIWEISAIIDTIAEFSLVPDALAVVTCKRALYNIIVIYLVFEKKHKR